MIKNKKINEKRGLKDWFRRLYGLEDEKQEDLEFMYSLYSNSNEKPNRVTNIIFLLTTVIFSVNLLY
jgi:adhesin transport system membrane fusion protein